MPTFTVSSLWRFPVKSMVGEEIESVDVTANGVCGDRAYAVVDVQNGKVGSAKNVKRFSDLLKCKVQWVTQPDKDNPAPPIRITMPDGTVVESGKPEADAALSGMFGAVKLLSNAPAGLKLEFAAGTVGGKHAQKTETDVAAAAPPGRFFDYACIHLITTSSLRKLQDAYPAGLFAIRRFRPNIVVDTGDAAAFVENSWAGRALAIGPNLVVRVSIPAPRCVMTTLARLNMPLDPGILRTIADQNKLDMGDYGQLPCMGVYADVVTPGHIGRGDEVIVG